MVTGSAITLLGKAGRLAVVAAASAALMASASSGANRPARPPASYGDYGPPEPQQMDSGKALGLWKSSFGAVKLEHDPAGGPGGVRGVWVYERSGHEVIGYFAGGLRGNVLRFHWDEPARPAHLKGDGYLVFDPGGRSFSGKWWTDSRDRGGDWNGWRAAAGEGGPAPEGAPDQGAAPDRDGPGPGPGSPPPPPDERKGPAEQAAPPVQPQTI